MIGCVSMGKAQRDKGWRTENNVRKKALDHGLEGSYRVPLSGGASIKGVKQIYVWRGDNDALVIKADNKPELVVLDMSDFFDLLAGKHDV